MKRVFDVVVEKDEESGWFVATVPAFRGCVTQGKTMADLRKNVIEAIELCLEDPPGESNAVTRFVGIERVEVSA